MTFWTDVLVDASAPLFRHRTLTPDIDPRRLQRAVGFLHRAEYRESGAGFEIAFGADLVAPDRHAGGHDDLLLPLLVFERDGRTIDARHICTHRPVGHGAVRYGVGPVALAGAAHFLREDMNFERFLGAIGLRHGGAADEEAFLDVGERGVDHVDHAHVVGELDRKLRTLARLDRQRVAVEFFNRTAYAHRLLLLRPGTRRRQNGHQGRDGQNAIDAVHVLLRKYQYAPLCHSSITARTSLSI